MRITIRTWLLGGQALMAALLLGLVLQAWSGARQSGHALDELYTDRVVPLRHIKTVSDAYAVFVVDASHKARNGNWSFADAQASVAKAVTDVRDAWGAFAATRTTEAERATLAPVLPHLRAAEALTRDLEAAMRAQDMAQLTSIVRERMYQTLDPLTEQLDALVAQETEAAEATYATATAAQHRDLLVVGGLALVALLASAGIGLVVALWVTRPLSAITTSMRSLADGDTTVVVPGRNRSDEIGAMAAALEVFRTQGEEASQLRQAQEADRVAAFQARVDALRGMADQVESETLDAMTGISDQARRLAADASAMAGAAGRVDQNAGAVGAAATESLAVAETVAAAAEELSASIRGIAEQVREAAEVSRGTASDSSETETAIVALSGAVGQISEVTSLIQEIAGKTNLLALNATIEAARAGDAGKGFAVVAGEVKGLAAQTAKATEEIGRHIDAVRSRTDAAVASVRRIAESVARIDQLAAALSGAVGQQDSATREIAQSIAGATQAAREVTERITEVSTDAREAGTRAASTQQETANLAAQAEALTHQVVSILRTAVPEVNRREHERHPIDTQAALSIGAARHTVRLTDIGAGGVRVQGPSALRVGERGTLTMPGKPPVQVEVRNLRDGMVGMAFTTPQAGLVQDAA